MTTKEVRTGVSYCSDCGKAFNVVNKVQLHYMKHCSACRYERKSKIVANIATQKYQFKDQNGVYYNIYAYTLGEAKRHAKLLNPNLII